MKSFKNLLINERLKLNKNSKAYDYEVFDYNEFCEEIINQFHLDKSCTLFQLNNVQYQFKEIKDDKEFKELDLFNKCADFINHPNNWKKDPNIKKYYSDNIVDVDILYYIDKNFFFLFIDHFNDLFKIYQLIEL